MPTYDYVCEKCGLQFEKFQSMNDARLAACPKDVCGQKRWGKGKVRRILGTGAGLIFKGSGFYITDYRSENYKQGAKKDTAPTAAASESKGAADSKPAAATPAAAPAAPAKSESKPAKPKRSAS